MKLPKCSWLGLALVPTFCLSACLDEEENPPQKAIASTQSDTATAAQIEPDPSPKKVMPKSPEELKKKLTPLQYHVTQACGTEPPFKNAYWDNKKEGIYVDIISGEALFSSTTKFDSGSGWPAFYEPIHKEEIVEVSDETLGMRRVEVRSKTGDAHLGHVFDDAPGQPTGLRYCINSASLRFVPKEEMDAEGYGKYLKLFEKEKPAEEAKVEASAEDSQ